MIGTRMEAEGCAMRVTGATVKPLLDKKNIIMAPSERVLRSLSRDSQTETHQSHWKARLITSLVIRRRLFLSLYFTQSPQQFCNSTWQKGIALTWLHTCSIHAQVHSSISIPVCQVSAGLEVAWGWGVGVESSWESIEQGLAQHCSGGFYKNTAVWQCWSSFSAHMGSSRKVNFPVCTKSAWTERFSKAQKMSG